MPLHFSRSDMNRMAKQVEQHNKRANKQVSAMMKRRNQQLSAIMKAHARVSPKELQLTSANMKRLRTPNQVQLSASSLNRIKREVAIQNGRLANTAKLLANAQREMKRAQNMTRLVHGTKAQRALRYALQKVKNAYTKAKSVVKKLQSVSPSMVM